MAEKLPANVMVTNVSVSHNIPSFTTESLNLQQSSKTRGLHRLEGKLDISIYNLESQRAWQAFITKAKGRANTFELDLPLHFESLGVSNPPIATNVSVGTTEIPVVRS